MGTSYVYDIPTPHPNHFLQIAHYRSTVPLRKLSDSLWDAEKSTENDLPKIWAVIDAVQRLDLSRVNVIAKGYSKSFRVTTTPQSAIAAGYHPDSYPGGTCLFTSYVRGFRVKEGNGTEKRWTILCWKVDISAKNFFLDKVSIYESYITDRGANPYKSFQALATSVFKSLKPQIN